MYSIDVCETDVYVNLKFMKRLFVWAAGVLLLAACHSEEGSSGVGKTEMILSLYTDLSFVKTKAIDVSEYTDVYNYTVELSQGGTVLEAVKFGDMELTKELEPGEYFVRAYYGENVAAGYDKLYVEGSQHFTLAKGDSRQVKFTCVPANAKVNVRFEDSFFEFYSDCKVCFTTRYLSDAFVMTKEDIDKDAFFRVGENEEMTLAFELKDLQGMAVSPSGFSSQKVILQPRDFLTITIKPKLIDVEGGKIDGITVTVDDGVISQDIPVQIPDEFLPAGSVE